MALRELLLPRDSQPQEAVGIDWGNPLSAGLVLAWSGGIPGANAATGRATASNTAWAAQVGTAGVALGDVPSGPAFPIPPSSACTIICLANISNATTNQVLSSYGGLSGGFGFSLHVSGGKLAGSAGSSNSPVSLGTANVPLGVDVCMAIAATPSSITGYLNGSPTGSANPTGDTNPSGGTYYINRAAAGNRLTAGITYLSMAWPRVLSAVEIAQISANPWQLFEPRRVYVPAAAAVATFNPAWARNRNTIITGPLR